MGAGESLLSSLNQWSHQLGFLEKSLCSLEGVPFSLGKKRVRGEKDLVELVSGRLQQVSALLSQERLPMTTMALATLPDLLQDLRKVAEGILQVEKKLAPTKTVPFEALNDLDRNTVQLLQSVDEATDRFSKRVAAGEKPPKPGIPGVKGALAYFASWGGTVASTFLGARVSEECDTKIEEEVQKLESLKPSSNVKSFSKTVGSYLTSFLKEHILHINDREKGLRPPFLKHFFNDPFSDDPKMTSLGTFVTTLLERKEETVKKIIEANVLRGFTSAYTRIHEMQEKNPDFLVEISRKCLEMAMQHIQHEIRARERAGLSDLGIEERNALLTGEFQRELSKAILGMAFPKGSEDLFFPDIYVPLLPDSIKNPIMNSIKRELFSTLEDGLGELFFHVFRDLSQGSAIKHAVMIEGYTTVIDFLEKKEGAPSVQEDTAKALSRPDLAIYGVLAGFVRALFSSALEGAQKPEQEGAHEYLGQTHFNRAIEDILSSLSKGSSVLSLVKWFASRKLSQSVGSSIVNSMRELSLIDLVDKQIKEVERSLEANESTILTEGRPFEFPRTKEEVLAVEKKRKEAEEKNERLLKDLEKRLGNDIEGLILTTWASFS